MQETSFKLSILELHCRRNIDGSGACKANIACVSANDFRGLKKPDSKEVHMHHAQQAHHDF